MKNNTVIIASIEALSNFAKEFGDELTGGEVIILSGELGAGKTTFVKALVSALGGTNTVTSPTFVLRNEYVIKDNTFFHIDLYRLEKTSVTDLEFFERLGEKSTFSCIEWPERIKDIKNLPGKKIKLTFSITGEHSRRIKIT